MEIGMEFGYSVLMSVYGKEKPHWLRQSMESIYEQTVKTDNFVLVCDGPLPEALNKIIEEMQQKFGECLYIHRLAENGGLGRALNIGIKDCRHELVARMDSDDISYQKRCEKEIHVFERHPEISIVSGTVDEFTADIHDIQGRRTVPEHQRDILSFAKRRNPFNHPCVMYKKSAVEKAGGYEEFFLLEDYFLWIRMLQCGFRGCNIGEPLLAMRVNEGFYERRGGMRYALSQVKLMQYMRSIGFITEFQCCLQSLIRTAAALVPNSMRRLLFQSMVRQTHGQ